VAHVVFPDKKSIPVNGVAAWDKETDVAILSLTSRTNIQPLELSSGALPPVGAKVYAIGNPLGQFANSLSDGLVSGHREPGTVPHFPNLPTMIQTTAPISHGSSGGPLLGADGKVVGVMTQTWEDVGGRNVNLAVPIRHVARLLDRCEDSGSLTKLPLVREPDASDFIDRGDAFTRKGEFDNAIKEYTEAIRLDASCRFAYVFRGNAWYEKKEYDRAIQDFGEALRLDPASASIYCLRGAVWAIKNDLDRAIEDFDEAIRLDSANADAFVSRGQAWLAKNNYDQAIQDYDHAIRLDPSKAPIVEEKRRIAWSRKAEVDRARSARSNDSIASFNSGRSWLAKKELDRALQEFNEAIRLNPAFGSAYGQRGIVWAQKRDYDRAIADYSEAIRLIPNEAWNYFNRGLAWSRKREFDNAIQDFDTALRINPTNAKAFVNRGRAWMAKNDDGKAIRDYDEGIRLDPKNAFAYRLRSYARMSKGNIDQAINDCEAAIRIAPADAAAYLDLGQCHMMKWDYEQAIRAYSEAIRLDPTNSKAYRGRGNGRSGKKEYDKAIEDFDAAIRLNRKDGEAYRSRGHVREDKREYSKAVEDYQIALRLDPENAANLAYLDLALLLASCPDENIRDGKRAIWTATKGCELTSWRFSLFLDALAAAHAEVGQFDDAVRYEKKALEDPGLGASGKEEYRQRLDLYTQKKPYRKGS
jgi:tetratricopeptide (TPR) repeat protein